jgi:hypothetical protein
MCSHKCQFQNQNYRLRSTLSSDDSMALSGSEDGRILVWDTINSKVIHELWHDDSMKVAQNSKRNISVRL